ncbi:MAG: GNAT family N-acetyltransferase [Anaerolineales bacterium]|jgi:RimJ/RimL family protein N-acetyltransferase|nr:GNAT family N-acetyltransferase [Anaerolineales bacterium]
MIIQPVTLTAPLVRLEPLTEAHVPDLAAVGLVEGIWRFMRYGNVQTEAQMLAWVRELLAWQETGNDLPFAVIWLPTGRAVGCTRYLNINRNHRSVEIGGTWYGLEYQGTLVNPSSKYLLLRHAFETLDCVRVQFKADRRNLRSQRALERLGAVQEGILRNHMILEGGHIRDSVFYSILPEEWPPIKARLETMLGLG